MESRSKRQAKRILVHYFELVAKAAGTPLNSDCISEIEGIVDDIVNAAVEEAIDDGEDS